MKHSPLLAGAALALILELSGCGLADTGAAEGEVDRFHKHWNADEFKAMYDEAHENFRSKTAEQTIAVFDEVKKNYGTFKSTTRQGFEVHTKNGVTRITLEYKSVYERAVGIEKFVYQVAGGKPKLVRYEVNSEEEAAKEREAAKKKSGN